MMFLRAIFLYSLLFALAGTNARAELSVITSILPINALVSGITHGISQPDNLLSPGSSPHHYVIKPSDIRRLKQAELIIWVGPLLEGSLAKPLLSLNKENQILTLIDLPKLALIHSSSTDPHSDEPAESASRQLDPHIWLSPDNALVIISAVTDALISMDSKNQKAYQENADSLSKAIKDQQQQLKIQLEPYRHLPFIVHHDAYQYFIRYFELNQAGHITLNDESRPGARHLSRIRSLIREQNIKCIFTEPQTNPALARVLAQDTGSRLVIIDPIGTESTDNPLAYTDTIQRMADGFTGCLEKTRA